KKTHANLSLSVTPLLVQSITFDLLTTTTISPSARHHHHHRSFTRHHHHRHLSHPSSFVTTTIASQIRHHHHLPSLSLSLNDLILFFFSTLVVLSPSLFLSFESDFDLFFW
ncbi:hypothetical protein IGI04_015678, partial [Brassica rapa subsp. trilocularis]